MSARVAIIGAGPSGLVAAKYALQRGLTPVVLEKADAIGGVFRGPKANPPGFAWSAMQTNTSVYTTRFSGLTPNRTSRYPFYVQQDVNDYLQGYVRRFELQPHIFLNHPVSSVKRVPGAKRSTKWLVKTDGDQVKEEVFDYLVFAAGRFATPYVPQFRNLDAFQGKVLHSADFGRLNQENAFRNKRVLVIGAAVSAFEIVPLVAKQAVSVTHVIKQMPYVIPRWIPTEKESVMKPWDTVLLSRSRHPTIGQEIRLKSPEIFQLEHQAFLSLANQQCGNPNLDPKKTAAPTEPPRVTSGIEYINMMINQQGVADKIQMEVGSSVSRFVSSGVQLDNKKQLDCDVVLLCTGFQTNMRFFEPEVLQTIEQDRSGGDPYLELILYKLTFRPELPSLAFIGMHDFPLWLFSELQSRWIMDVFSGKLPFPNGSKVTKYLEEERQLRLAVPRKQSPHDDLVGFADSIAAEIGTIPDFKRLQSQDPELFQKLVNGTLMYEHVDLDTSASNESENARRVIDLMSNPTFNSADCK